MLPSIAFVNIDEVKGRLIDNVKKLLNDSKAREKQVDALTELLSVNQWSNLSATMIGKLQNVQKCMSTITEKFYSF